MDSDAREKPPEARQRPGPALTYCMGSVLFPVHRGLSVLWWVGLGNSCCRRGRWGSCHRGGTCHCHGCRCRRRRGLLLGELLPEGLLPRLHHVGHHRVDQGEGLYGAAIKHCAILWRKPRDRHQPSWLPALAFRPPGEAAAGRTCGPRGRWKNPAFRTMTTASAVGRGQARVSGGARRGVTMADPGGDPVFSKHHTELGCKGHLNSSTLFHAKGISCKRYSP